MTFKIFLAAYAAIFAVYYFEGAAPYGYISVTEFVVAAIFFTIAGWLVCEEDHAARGDPWHVGEWWE